MKSEKLSNIKGQVFKMLKLQRDPTEAEEEYLIKWICTYNHSEEVITKACYLTINYLKPSFHYIDAILKQWYQKELKTLAEVEEYLEAKYHQEKQVEEKLNQLTGRQLYLLRTRDTGISDLKLSKMLNISISDILNYEYDKKHIPNELYNRWISIIENTEVV